MASISLLKRAENAWNCARYASLTVRGRDCRSQSVVEVAPACVAPSVPDGCASAMRREVEEVLELASGARDVESDLIAVAEYPGQCIM